MTKKLVIFGCGDIAQLAHFYFTKQSDYQVVAFAVDSQYLKEPSFCGLPLVEFELLEEIYPPSDFDLFIAISYSGINRLRMEKFNQAKRLGYSLASFVSPHATILNEGAVGENCFILEDNTIQPFVSIGDNVTLWSGNHIGHHSRIENHCFLASHIVVSGGVVIKERCFIGVNVTLRDHVTVGEASVIGAGALILSDVEPEGVYMGTTTARSKVPSSRLRHI